MARKLIIEETREMLIAKFEHPLGEKNVRAEARNIARNYPVFPGDTISHSTAAECERRGWIKRNDIGYWVPTEICPFMAISCGRK